MIDIHPAPTAAIPITDGIKSLALHPTRRRDSLQSFEQNLALTALPGASLPHTSPFPQQEVDAAWANFAEPGNAAALSPTQMDSLERALQIALADDDAMLTYCYNIKRNLKNNPAS